MTTHSDNNSLRGRRIGVPESRQLDLFSDMLERRGAVVARCPLIDIRDAPDSAPVQAWLDNIIANGLDDMIWLTGEGVRRLTAFLQRAGDDRLAAFVKRLAASRAITRGPKPTRELRALGLKSDLAATAPTTDGVIDALSDQNLAGRRVGVQLYGTDPNTPLMTFLSEKQAIALPVAPYVYADEAEEPQVLAFVDAIAAGEFEAVAFTSSPQVRRLFKVAARHDRQSALIDGLQGLCVAAVGPLVAQQLTDAGTPPALMPQGNYFMKPLVRSLAEYFREHAR